MLLLSLYRTGTGTNHVNLRRSPTASDPGRKMTCESIRGGKICFLDSSAISRPGKTNGKSESCGIFTLKGVSFDILPPSSVCKFFLKVAIFGSIWGSSGSLFLCFLFSVNVPPIVPNVPYFLLGVWFSSSSVFSLTKLYSSWLVIPILVQMITIMLVTIWLSSTIIDLIAPSNMRTFRRRIFLRYSSTSYKGEIKHRR